MKKRAKSNGAETVSVSNLLWISLAVIIAVGSGAMIISSYQKKGEYTAEEVRKGHKNPFGPIEFEQPIVESRPCYRVSFDPGENLPPIDDQYIEEGNTAFTPPPPEKDGAVFVGWEPSIELTPIVADATFTAVWEEQLIGDIHIIYRTTYSYANRYQFSMTVLNNTNQDLENWHLSFNIDNTILDRYDNSATATFTGNYYVFTPPPYWNTVIPAGDRLPHNIGGHFISDNDIIRVPYNIVVNGITATIIHIPDVSPGDMASWS